jgi:hypothetical protein
MGSVHPLKNKGGYAKILNISDFEILEGTRLTIRHCNVYLHNLKLPRP